MPHSWRFPFRFFFPFLTFLLASYLLLFSYHTRQLLIFLTLPFFSFIFPPSFQPPLIIFHIYFATFEG